MIEPRVFRDQRGFFLETFSYREVHHAGIKAAFVQDNHSLSAANVLRECTIKSNAHRVNWFAQFVVKCLMLQLIYDVTQQRLVTGLEPC